MFLRFRTPPTAIFPSLSPPLLSRPTSIYPPQQFGPEMASLLACGQLYFLASGPLNLVT